jgi:hypothetical protein
MDITSLALFKNATILATATQSNTIDVRGYDVMSVQKDTNATGTSFSFKGNFDGLGTVVPIRDASNTAVTLAATSATAQLLLFQQGKELRALNQLAIITNAANAGADAVLLVGLRWIT